MSWNSRKNLEIHANSTDVCGLAKCFKSELPEFKTMEREQGSTNKWEQAEHV